MEHNKNKNFLPYHGHLLSTCMTSKYTMAASVILSLVLYTSCSASSFSSASGGKSSSDAVGANGKSTAGAANSIDVAADSGGTTAGADAGAAQGIKGSASNQCGTADPLNYNILFVFDKTGSQLQTDPTLVRRSGALDFLNSFSTYVNANPSAAVNMEVMAFNTVAIPEGGWSLLSSSTAPTIQQEIITATSDPEGETAYSPALNAAATDFSQINSQPGAATARDYVIFLTDGLPDDDTQTAITAAVNNLVNNEKVAIIAVATGPDVPANGAATVQALALPTSPTIFPDHVGHYYRAAAPADIANVWSSIFGQIGAACSSGSSTGS